MSYRDPKQSLEDPATKILEGIRQFRVACLARVLSGEWSEEHIEEIEEIVVKLSVLEFPLSIICTNHW